MMDRSAFAVLLLFPVLVTGCSPLRPIRLITLDPGHFHAALVQKSRSPRMDREVHVFAPPGKDLEDHLARIEGFNTRAGDPTDWIERVYRGDDFLDELLKTRPGDVVVIAGNNREKAEYIKACVQAGLHVLADKPMCIDPDGYQCLREAFALAEEKGLLLCDIMTERFEITSVLQRELVSDAEVFGTLKRGTPEDPSVIEESVHHFYKTVAGRPLQRPGWYFDTDQQGEGIVDVTTHLVDLVFWTCFPGRKMHFPGDIILQEASRWPTLLTRDQYSKATGLERFPPYLERHLNGRGELACFANGEIRFEVLGANARVRVMWEYQAPEGGGDTHFSLLKGSRAQVTVRQGAEQGYRPELYLERQGEGDGAKWEAALDRAIARLASRYPGIGVVREENAFRVKIPDALRLGHEAHFRQVLDRFIQALDGDGLPKWERANMLAKYGLTTEALASCRPPKEAQVLFDGRGFSCWTGATWTLDHGEMRVVPGAGSLMTWEKYQDFRLHLEFKVPVLPPLPEGADRGNRGNSGVYLQRRYEVQILDSYGHDPQTWDCGALYRAKAPDVNACKKAGEWQTYDIVFRAPRFESQEKKANARITVWQNGLLIHDDVALENKTGQGLPEGPQAGPILLQDHGNEVAFRNIWIVPFEPVPARPEEGLR